MTPEMIEKWSLDRVAPVVLYMVSGLSGSKTNKTLFASGSKVMELKMMSSAGIPNGKHVTAHDIAAAADRLFMLESDTPINFNG